MARRPPTAQALAFVGGCAIGAVLYWLPVFVLFGLVGGVVAAVVFTFRKTASNGEA